MSVFGELAGQAVVREQLERAAVASRADGSNSAMSQAWLFTGPPGSGRSNAARALAAALECAMGFDQAGGLHPGQDGAGPQVAWGFRR